MRRILPNPLFNFLKLSIAVVLLVLPLLSLALEGEAVTANDYRMGTGDRVRIQVYGEEDLNLETTVSDNGEISYPFLGPLKVAGLTPQELAQLITGKLQGDYLVNPKVSVDIIQYRLFYVNGEVESPGGYPFQPGITVRKAISIAGGFRERAAKDKIFVIRDDNPQAKPAPMKLDDMIRPGDIITVEESFF